VICGRTQFKVRERLGSEDDSCARDLLASSMQAAGAVTHLELSLHSQDIAMSRSLSVLVSADCRCSQLGPRVGPIARPIARRGDRPTSVVRAQCLSQREIRRPCSVGSLICARRSSGTSGTRSHCVRTRRAQCSVRWHEAHPSLRPAEARVSVSDDAGRACLSPPRFSAIAAEPFCNRSALRLLARSIAESLLVPGARVSAQYEDEPSTPARGGTRHVTVRARLVPHGRGTGSSRAQLAGAGIPSDVGPCAQAQSRGGLACESRGSGAFVEDPLASSGFPASLCAPVNSRGGIRHRVGDRSFPIIRPGPSAETSVDAAQGMVPRANVVGAPSPAAAAAVTAIESASRSQIPRLSTLWREAPHASLGQVCPEGHSAVRFRKTKALSALDDEHVRDGPFERGTVADSPCLPRLMAVSASVPTQLASLLRRQDHPLSGSKAQARSARMSSPQPELVVTPLRPQCSEARHVFVEPRVISQGIRPWETSLRLAASASPRGSRTLGRPRLPGLTLKLQQLGPQSSSHLSVGVCSPEPVNLALIVFLPASSGRTCPRPTQLTPPFMSGSAGGLRELVTLQDIWPFDAILLRSPHPSPPLPAIPMRREGA